MNIIFASAITGDSTIFEQLKYMLTSFTLVMGVLLTMALVTALLGIFFRFMDKPKAPAKATASQSPAAASSGSATVAAVVSSAVYATMDGAPHRVLSITPSDASADAKRAAIISAAVYAALDGAPHRIESVAQVNPWVISGRQAIFNSKNPKK